MYEIFKSIIETGAYELVDILKKINTNWVTSEITDEQRVELITLAQEKAKPENSYAPLQKQIDDLYNKIQTINDDIAKLSDRVLSIEKGEPQEPVEPEPPVEDEYPEYVQPSGAHDAYNEGDKVTFEGEKYICKMNGCVWSPKDYPQGWEKVVDEVEPEEPDETVDEYPEFVQPTGSENAYNTGDKITFNGEKYICKMDGCTWSPTDYADAWEKVVEQSTLEEPPTE